jgi:hypothetical protein
MCVLYRVLSSIASAISFGSQREIYIIYIILRHVICWVLNICQGNELVLSVRWSWVFVESICDTIISLCFLPQNSIGTWAHVIHSSWSCNSSRVHCASNGVYYIMHEQNHNFRSYFVHRRKQTKLQCHCRTKRWADSQNVVTQSIMHLDTRRRGTTCARRRGGCRTTSAHPG